MQGIIANFERGAATWTEERLADLKRLHADGLTGSQLAGALGITRNSAIGKLHRLGLKGNGSKSNPGPRRTARTADADRSAKQRIAKIIKVRSPSNGGTRVEKAVVREEHPAPPDFLGIPLLELESYHCRFPQGEGRTILFCGQQTVGSTSWCKHCLGVVSAPPRPRVERPYLPLGNSKPAAI